MNRIEPDMVDELLVLEGLGSSDHSMLLWTCQLARRDFEKKLATDIKFDKKSFFCICKK